MKRFAIVDKALDDIQAMKQCPGHEWTGPIEDHGEVGFIAYCKHCPLAKGFRTLAAAEQATGVSK